ncbi:MAG: transporter [Chitinophagaceae bacterium]|nr:transporter [Chitinophagaceae bacterium]MDB5224316.1 transporter [Chitinophagaceae bacterium]
MLTQTVSLYRNAYGGLSRSTWWLALVMLINRSGTMVVPFMTIYMTQHIGVSISKAGFVMSLFGSGAVIGALIGGRLTDRLGSYYIQITTLVGGGIMFIVLGQMRTYVSICICTFLLAFINEAFRPANSVAVAHYSKEENRTRSYSLNRLAINLGWAVGGGLGGLIASYNYELLFWVDGLTNLSGAVLLYFVLAPSRNVATEVKIKKEKIAGKTAYQDSNYMIFIFLLFLFAMCFFQLFTTIPVFYKEQFHLTIFFIGMVMTLNGLIISLFEMITIFKLEGRRPLLHFISLGVVLVGIAYLMLNAPVSNKEALAIIIMLLFTFGEILSMPFMNSYFISRTLPHNRGQYAALFTVAWASAQAIGPFIGGLIAENYGYDILWFGVAGVCVLIALLYRLLHKKNDIHSLT